LASVILLAILGGAFYTHNMLNDPFERMAPCIVFSLLIICRLVIFYQVNKREKQEMELLKQIMEGNYDDDKDIDANKNKIKDLLKDYDLDDDLEETEHLSNDNENKKEQ
jgi:hypothetical protein